MSFLRAFLLRLRELFASPALVLVLALMPVLLGLTAGAANLRNRDTRVRVAVADLDGTETSRGLVASLRRQGWDILEAGEHELPRLVDGRAVDGALVIQPGFSAQIGSLSAGGLTYTPAEGTLTTNMVLDAVTMSVIPFKSSQVFLQQAAALYRSSGVPLPPDFADTFRRRTAENLVEEARQEFDYVGSYVEQPALTYVVNDYSMEVMFLGFFALLGTLALDTPGMKRRLRALPRGLPYDYGASLLALVLVGFAQILLYMVSMRGLMRQAVSGQELLVLSAFLLISLAVARMVALMDEGIRLYLGLIALLLFSLAGGCFLQLPEQMIRSLGQYIPHGWAMAALRGYPVLPALPAAGIALLSRALIYPLHARLAGRLKT